MNPLAAELAQDFYILFQDMILNYTIDLGKAPTVIHVTRELEHLLTAYHTVNKTKMPPTGIRGWDHILGMRVVWDAPSFKLSTENKYDGKSDSDRDGPVEIAGGVLPGPR